MKPSLVSKNTSPKNTRKAINKSTTKKSPKNIASKTTSPKNTRKAINKSTTKKSPKSIVSKATSPKNTRKAINKSTTKKSPKNIASKTTSPKNTRKTINKSATEKSPKNIASKTTSPKNTRKAINKSATEKSPKNIASKTTSPKNNRKTINKSTPKNTKFNNVKKTEISKSSKIPSDSSETSSTTDRRPVIHYSFESIDTSDTIDRLKQIFIKGSGHLEFSNFMIKYIEQCLTIEEVLFYQYLLILSDPSMTPIKFINALSISVKNKSNISKNNSNLLSNHNEIISSFLHWYNDLIKRVFSLSTYSSFPFWLSVEEGLDFLHDFTNIFNRKTDSIVEHHPSINILLIWFILFVNRLPKMVNGKSPLTWLFTSGEKFLKIQKSLSHLYEHLFINSIKIAVVLSDIFEPNHYNKPNQSVDIFEQNISYIARNVISIVSNIYSYVSSLSVFEQQHPHHYSTSFFKNRFICDLMLSNYFRNSQTYSHLCHNNNQSFQSNNDHLHRNDLTTYLLRRKVYDKFYNVLSHSGKGIVKGDIPMIYIECGNPQDLVNFKQSRISNLSSMIEIELFKKYHGESRKDYLLKTRALLNALSIKEENPSIEGNNLDINYSPNSMFDRTSSQKSSGTQTSANICRNEIHNNNDLSIKLLSGKITPEHFINLGPIDLADPHLRQLRIEEEQSYESSIIRKYQIPKNKNDLFHPKEVTEVVNLSREDHHSSLHSSSPKSSIPFDLLMS